MYRIFTTRRNLEIYKRVKLPSNPQRRELRRVIPSLSTACALGSKISRSLSTWNYASTRSLSEKDGEDKQRRVQEESRGDERGSGKDSEIRDTKISRLRRVEAISADREGWRWLVFVWRGREVFVRPSRTNGRENEYHLFRNTHPGTDPSAERGILTAEPRLSRVTKFRDLGARGSRARLRRGTFFSANAPLASLSLVIAVEDEAFIAGNIRANLHSTSFLKGKQTFYCFTRESS